MDNIKSGMFEKFEFIEADIFPFFSGLRILKSGKMDLGMS